MTPLKKTARIAGLWYLMLALGLFYLLCSARISLRRESR